MEYVRTTLIIVLSIALLLAVGWVVVNVGRVVFCIIRDWRCARQHPKPDPKIIVEVVQIKFHRDHEGWGFTYRGAEFSSFELSLTLPTKRELDAILDTLESLKPEMKSRLKKVLSKWGDSTLDDGESYLVDVEAFATERTFTVSWSGGASWGDLGVDFTIKDHAIIDEVCGD